MMICFDTPAVIWGVRGVASPGQEGMISRTKKYIKYLEPKKEKIMIPAPALAEYLMGCETPQQRAAEAAEIERHFMVPAFDARAAHKAGEIYNKDLEKAIRASGGCHQCLRTDIMIIAVAIVNNADKIVTSDSHFLRLAHGLITVIEVPELDEQSEFFF